MEHKVEALTDMVRDLMANLSESSVKVDDSCRKKPREPQTLLWLPIVVVVAAIETALFFGGGGNAFFVLGSFTLIPAALGAAIGARFTATSPRLLATLGLVYGMSFVTILQILNPRDLSRDWDEGLLFAVTHLFLFLTGALVSKWIARKRSGSNRATGTAERIAAALLDVNTTSMVADKRVGRIADVISAIAPLLTFIASVIGAFLTYLATKGGSL